MAFHVYHVPRERPPSAKLAALRAQLAHAGTGLGLAITKGYREAHGATIEHDAFASPGATLHVRLPFALSEPEAGEHIISKQA